MRSAGYGLLLAIAGCSQGLCRARCGGPAHGVVRPAATRAAASARARAPSNSEQEALNDLIEPLRSGGRTLIAEPPDKAEEAAFQAWVAGAALAAQRGQPAPAAAPRGFTLRAIPGRHIWLLSEDETRRRGSGVIALRVGPARPLLVEAPHTFFDQKTLPVALAVFEAQQARALMINTSHRYGGPRPDDAAQSDGDSDDGTDDGEHAAGPAPSASAAAALPDPLAFADVAHAERSFFLTAHKALLDSLPGLPTLQLHGFQDKSAPDTGVIASGIGHGARLDRLLGALRAAAPDVSVLGYPKEIAKLGGTSNVQRRWSRQVGAPFYHLEMSRTLRDRLDDEPALLRRFAAAFTDIAVIAPAVATPAAP